MDVFDRIAAARGEELQELLQAVLRRYAVLYPDWEVNIYSLEKSQNKNEQLDRLIDFFKSRKDMS